MMESTKFRSLTAAVSGVINEAKNLKYEITDETHPNINALKRIRALRNIPGVAKKGDLGGYIMSEKNLDQKGNCWVSDNAQVWDNAKVSGNAHVSGAMVSGKAEVSGNAKVSGNVKIIENAKVSDNAVVSGNAHVYGNAKVYGKAEVSGNARVHGNAKVSGNAQVDDNATVYQKAEVSGDAWVFGRAVVAVNAKVSGYARVHGNATVIGELSKGTVTEGAEKDTKGDKEAYQQFFKKTLKKYGADSPEDLSDEDKKKFYDEIDAGWKADDEKPEKNESVELEEEVKYYKTLSHLKWALEFDIYGEKNFKKLKIVKLKKDHISIQTPSGQELDRYQHIPKLGWTELGESNERKESVELEEAVKPKVGHEVRFTDSDGSISVDKIYHVFDDRVETDKTYEFKTKDLIWKGKYWEVSPKGRKESVELEEDFGSDEAMVMELELFAENDRGLYNQFRSIIKNLIGKEINGKYDHKAAIKLWGYYADAAAKAYAKEFGGPDFRSLLTVRRSLAKKLADQELPAIKGALQGVNMEYEDLLPKNKKKIEAYRASMNESVEELEEKRKSRYDYEIYHDSYSSALSEVLDLVERNGYKVNEDLWFNKVSTGPRKPSDGKTNSFTLELEKDGKETRKVVSFQVYAIGSGRYELNAYIS